MTQWQRVALTDRERTLLDVMAHPHVFGGMGASIELLEANWPAVDSDKLVSYALRYGVAATIKRLGYWLERFGAPADLLQPLAEYLVAGYVPLDPAGPSRGEMDSRWRIRLNLVRTNNDGDR